MAQHKIEQYKIDLNKYRLDTAIEDLTAAQHLTEKTNFALLTTELIMLFFMQLRLFKL